MVCKIVYFRESQFIMRIFAYHVIVESQVFSTLNNLKYLYPLNTTNKDKAYAFKVNTTRNLGFSCEISWSQ
jgi:hypothetical protein